jgi:predicted transcriptional regulator
VPEVSPVADNVSPNRRARLAKPTEKRTGNRKKRRKWRVLIDAARLARHMWRPGDDRMQPEHALTEFGFSELESNVYCELLRVAPATGYRLAQLIGKAPANVYQALASMARKGIVFIEEGETKSYRAVPPSELMAELQRDFDERRVSAQLALDAVYARPERDRIYQVRTPRQVFERGAGMIERAREILLFDLFPEPFALLRPALEAAAASGVTVAGVTYGDVPKVPFTCVCSPGNPLRDRWPGQQVTIIADAEEYVMALLDGEGERVLHGVWSESHYLACMRHDGLASEIRLAVLNLERDPLMGIGLLSAVPRGLRELLAETEARVEPDKVS